VFSKLRRFGFRIQSTFQQHGIFCDHPPHCDLHDIDRRTLVIECAPLMIAEVLFEV